MDSIIFVCSFGFAVLNYLERHTNEAWVFNFIGWVGVFLVFLGGKL